MTATTPRKRHPLCVSLRGRGFTLIELLTVIAIISLLIGILLPSLSRAKDQAKTVKTRALLKSISTGLEIFRTENEKDKQFQSTDGLPPSAAAEDQTETGSQSIFGAQWLVRYLMGKDFKGFIPRSNAPAALLNAGADDEQVLWYEPDPAGDGSIPALDRVGPYIPSDAVDLVRPKDLPGTPPMWGMGVPGHANTPETDEQPVIVDTFGFPVLYYMANPRLASSPTAPLATWDGEDPGIYNFLDNGYFTGYCTGTPPTIGCVLPGWRPGSGLHEIEAFGPVPAETDEDIRDHQQTFQYYIMAKRAFESSGGMEASPIRTPTVIPYNKDTFILLSPGKDGRYGTGDDVANF